jgi:hypothetical protein
LTAEALGACLRDIIALAACINGSVTALVFTDGSPDHQVVNNADPTTLYRSDDILAMLGGPGVTLVHNLFSRPVNCPLGTACVLHVLLIEFETEDDALAFFDRVTQTGLEGETVFAAPNASRWKASKCAEGTRASSTAGAPPFAVIYCSVSLGPLHWGFNLSSYETLPAGFKEEVVDALMEAAYEYLSVWR